MNDPAVAFVAGVIAGVIAAGIWSIFVHSFIMKGWRQLVNNLIQQRTHLVGQRQSLRRDFRGLASAGEVMFAHYIGSLTHIDNRTIYTVRRMRNALNRARKMES